MNIICVDRSSSDLRNLIHQVRRLMPDATVHSCRDPDEAVTVAQHEGCDLLLTATDLGGLHTDGFMLAAKIQALNPRVNIIFITNSISNKEALSAFEIHASGYISKPYELEDLAREFALLRHKPA